MQTNLGSVFVFVFVFKAESIAVIKEEGGTLTEEASNHLYQTTVAASSLEAKLRGFSCG